MSKPSISGRVPQPLKDDFDEYREKNELSISDAQRELLRKGIEDGSDSPREQIIHTRNALYTVTGLISIGFGAVLYMLSATVLSAAFVAVALIALLNSYSMSGAGWAERVGKWLPHFEQPDPDMKVRRASDE